VYGGRGGSDRRQLRTGRCGPDRKGEPMKWIKPAFDEIKMDAEAKSYSGEGFEE
jgi:hypothetical protein